MIWSLVLPRHAQNLQMRCSSIDEGWPLTHQERVFTKDKNTNQGSAAETRALEELTQSATATQIERLFERQ